MDGSIAHPDGVLNVDPPRRRRSLDPRLLAPLALLIAFVAIALEIVYAVGHFFSDAASKIH
jgi:hypothetical protein